MKPIKVEWVKYAHGQFALEIQQLISLDKKDGCPYYQTYPPVRKERCVSSSMVHMLLTVTEPPVSGCQHSVDSTKYKSGTAPRTPGFSLLVSELRLLKKKNVFKQNLSLLSDL